MLVLTRRAGEELLIGDCIRVQVVSIQGARVRLGIEAPPDVEVDRAEIRRRRLEDLQEGVEQQPCSC